MASGQWQGTEGYKRGNLKRQLETIPVAIIDPNTIGQVGSETTLERDIWLTGLNGNLKVLIACGMQSEDFTSQPFPWPVNGGEMQLTPVTKFGDALKVFLRPVFQDPTAVDNQNHPLAQGLPFGWEGSFTEVDQIMIHVGIPYAAWAATSLRGTICVQVAVEYNGAWWDVEAFEYVMGQVQLQGAPNVPVIGSGGELI